ncbi:MAG: DNA mismatch repair protein MutL [Flammeovirgaceae bacterium]|nr:DNA mismatch repair protein MutL [Flammeovirgaceae bacterium]
MVFIQEFQEKEMSTIKQLPKSVANQIAAGEVIQRPASVVKELIENSIDAKSKNIKLIIKDAGKQSITIIDDGIGMDKNDIKKCFLRHSTSKLREAEDIYKVKTMGFRGEALSSISSVAELKVKTKTLNCDIGNEIIIKDSKILEESKSDIQSGTIINVKNLFFNIPARRNFLKSNNVELRHIIDEFIRCAISNFDVNFILVNEEAEMFNLKKSNLKKRIISIFKKSYEEYLIQCEEEFDSIKIKGFIGKPKNSKKTRGEQFIFVNNRFVKSSYLGHAIYKSYEGLLEEKKYPFYVLFINLNTEKVDINIHPTKTEIKFDDEKLIYSLVNSTIKKTLDKYNISPSINFDADVNFLKEVVTNYDNKDNSFRNKNDIKPLRGNDWEEIFENVRSENKTAKLFQDEDEPLTNNKPVQFLDKFIFKQLGEKLLVFNHKNCQQRIIYEKYEKGINKFTNTQQNLFPQYIDLNQSDFEIIKTIIEDIKSIGFDIDYFGENSVVVNGIPAGLNDINEKDLVEGFIEEVKNCNSDLDKEKRDKILKFFSKKVKIISSKILNEDQMNLIIDKLFACKNPKFTPDGKQNYIELGIEKVENLF